MLLLCADAGLGGACGKKPRSAPSGQEGPQVSCPASSGRAAAYRPAAARLPRLLPRARGSSPSSLQPSPVGACSLGSLGSLGSWSSCSAGSLGSCSLGSCSCSPWAPAPWAPWAALSGSLRSSGCSGSLGSCSSFLRWLPPSLLLTCLCCSCCLPALPCSRLLCCFCSSSVPVGLSAPGGVHSALPGLASLAASSPLSLRARPSSTSRQPLSRSLSHMTCTASPSALTPSPPCSSPMTSSTDSHPLPFPSKTFKTSLRKMHCPLPSPPLPSTASSAKTVTSVATSLPL
mmetsp:Transcript_104861/g.327971  ORF Transcript_104861/g.327971 Transcript_104861/m.327971 type:complete len:288 (-) Transcript_104861:161-1024(-)